MRRMEIALVVAGVTALALGGTAVAAKSLGNAAPAPAQTSSTSAGDARSACPPPGGHRSGAWGGLQAAATYLGVSAESLFAQLRTGKTLAQIATETSGKSASGLVDALVADAKARLGANAPSDLRQRITDLVERTLPARRPDRPDHDRWGGPPPPGRRA